MNSKWRIFFWHVRPRKTFSRVRHLRKKAS